MFTLMGATPAIFAFEKVFTIAEAADRLGISLSEAHHHVADGSLSAFKVGRGSLRRHLRVTDDDLDRFVAARRVGPTVRAPDRPSPGPRASGAVPAAARPLDAPRRARRAALPEGRPGAFLEALRARDGRA